MKSFISKILAVFALVLVVNEVVADWVNGASMTKGGTYEGDLEWDQNVTIPSEKTVTINGNLTIRPTGNKNITLIVEGTLKVNGNIIVEKRPNRSYYGNLTNEGTITAKNISVGSGSTLTINSENNMNISGNLTNNGTVTITSNLIVDGNVTNSGTISMNGGVLRIGTYETGTNVLKSGTGDLTLNNGSTLQYDNNSGKMSNVEVRGNLIGKEKSTIKSYNGGKGNLAVVGTYYDYVEDQDNYHPDWGASVGRLLLGTIYRLSFELKENPNVFLSAQHYELPEIDGTWLNDLLDALGFTDTEGKIKDILENKSVNAGNLDEILREISKILPIELVYFRAQQVDGNVEFTWQTASELNNDYFTIEYSLDAMEFEALATIAGAGTTTEEQNYQYTDFSAPESGTVYYRLKQTDYDGNYTYSDMVAVVFDKKQVIENPVNFVVYPNPASDYVTISGGEYQSVKFLSADGRVLKVEDAQNTHSVANMPNGVIYLVISTENGEVSKTLVKK